MRSGIKQRQPNDCEPQVKIGQRFVEPVGMVAPPCFKREGRNSPQMNPAKREPRSGSPRRIRSPRTTAGVRRPGTERRWWRTTTASWMRAFTVPCARRRRRSRASADAAPPRARWRCDAPARGLGGVDRNGDERRNPAIGGRPTHVACGRSHVLAQDRLDRFRCGDHVARHGSAATGHSGGTRCVRAWLTRGGARVARSTRSAAS